MVSPTLKFREARNGQSYANLVRLNLKLRKVRNGRSYADLARQAGCSPENIRKILDKGSEPKFILGVRLAQALDVSPNWLVDGGDSWPPPPATDTQKATQLVQKALEAAGLTGELSGMERQVISGLRQLPDSMRHQISAYVQGLLDSGQFGNKSPADLPDKTQ